MVSIIKVTSIQDTSGNNETTTANIKKSFDGSGKSFINHNAGTTINGSLNISSLTDNSTGDHSHSFTNNHDDIYYAATGSVISDSSVQTNTSTHSVITAGNTPSASVHTTSTLRYKVVHVSNTNQDHQMVQVVTHGDLA